MNIQDCIKNGIEKRLNCTIPDMSYGEALTPLDMSKNELCSTRAEFEKYKELYDKSIAESYPSEATIYKELGCIASCKESTQKEMNTLERKGANSSHNFQRLLLRTK